MKDSEYKRKSKRNRMFCSSPTPPFRLECATRSDVGMRRASNQDSVAVTLRASAEALASDQVLMVADGMGAHAAGELASKIAADSIPQAYLESELTSGSSALRHAVSEANDQIHAKGASSPEFQGMGTTCSCLVLSPSVAMVAHVGDSRVYRLRAGLLEQLTFDHSLVWEMAAAGRVSEDKIPSGIPKNIITRSLGPHEVVNIDLEGPHELANGDVFLLCSDGLTGVVNDTLIGGVLGALPPDEAAQMLVDLANLRGGPDNISVVVARISACGGDAKRAVQPERFCWGRMVAWLFAGVACLVAFCWFASIGNASGMLLSAAGCGAAAAFAGIKKTASGGEAIARTLDGTHGNGPYRKYECNDPKKTATLLEQLVEDLASLGKHISDSDVLDRKAMGGGLLVLDWSAQQSKMQEAKSAAQTGDPHRAIALYSKMVRTMMQSVRGEKNPKN